VTSEAPPVSSADVTIPEASEDDGSPPDPVDSGPSRAVSWTLLIAAAAVLPLLYLHTYAGQPVHALGWDSYGYIWQSRIAGIDPLSEVGTRLGVPMIGSLVEHVLGVDASVEPVVLGLSMMIGLAAATAVVIRLAFRLPAWTVSVIALVVGWWGGTARLASGYQANLLSLMLFIAATAIFLRSRGRTSMLLIGGAVMFACGIGHPGFMPVYVAVTAGWVVLSIPQLRRDRREGRRLLRTESVAALIAASGTLAVVAFIVFVPLHHSVTDVADLSVVSGLFGKRLAKLPTQTGAISTVPLAAIGFFVGYRMRRRREARVLSALGITWTLACVGGLLLGIVDSSFPAHRAVLFATPVAAAMGFGVAGVGRSIARLGSGAVARKSAAAVAVMAMAGAIVAVAAVGHRTYGDLVDSPRAYIEDPARRTAAYIATAKPQVPIIVVTNRPGIDGVLVTKLYYNATRAFAPTFAIPRILVYLGAPAQIERNQPSLIEDPTEDWEVGFNDISMRNWPGVEQALRQGAIILFNQEQVTPAVWETTPADNPTHQVAPGLFILRGPLVTPGVNIASPSISEAKVAFQVLLTLLLLIVAGGGYAYACVLLGGGTVLDAMGLAPAIGAAPAVLSGTAVASAQIVPGSPTGVLLFVAVSAAGYVIAAVLSRRMGGTLTAPTS
jgi:hypothetical protein